uniref:Uncharacterized protein n=1 Tax=Panagrolaimus sp. ES5 TaxID=591445 RepID=A0AC34FHB1_9BILA
MVSTLKAADIIDPLSFQIPIAMKWTLKQEDVGKKIFLYKASQYHLSSLPDVFLQFSLIKDGFNGDKIMFDMEVDRGSEVKIRSNLEIRVKSANFKKWTIGEEVEKGFYSSNFTTQKNLLNPEKSFFVDGNLILDIVGIISVDRPVAAVKKPVFFKIIFKVLYLLNHGKTDFSIFVKGKEIKVC